MDVAPWRHEAPQVHVECQTVVIKVSQPINQIFELNNIDPIHSVAIDFQ